MQSLSESSAVPEVSVLCTYRLSMLLTWGWTFCTGLYGELEPPPPPLTRVWRWPGRDEPSGPGWADLRWAGLSRRAGPGRAEPCWAGWGPAGCGAGAGIKMYWGGGDGGGRGGGGGGKCGYVQIQSSGLACFCTMPAEDSAGTNPSKLTRVQKTNPLIFGGNVMTDFKEYLILSWSV